MHLGHAQRRRRAHHLLSLVALAERLHEHDAGVAGTRSRPRRAYPAARSGGADLEQGCVGFTLRVRIESQECVARAQPEDIAQIAFGLGVQRALARF